MTTRKTKSRSTTDGLAELLELLEQKRVRRFERDGLVVEFHSPTPEPSSPAQTMPVPAKEAERGPDGLTDEERKEAYGI